MWAYLLNIGVNFGNFLALNGNRDPLHPLVACCDKLLTDEKTKQSWEYLPPLVLEGLIQSNSHGF